MTIAEEKLELIQKIIACNDINILMEIKAILHADKNQVAEPATEYQKGKKIRVFNEWQEDKINRAIKQYENRECISDEEAQKEIQGCLED